MTQFRVVIEESPCSHEMEVQIHDENGQIAFMLDVGPKTAHQAKLMAAAPDLLDKLKRVMSWIDNWSPEFSNDPDWQNDRDAIRAAIAKAVGVTP